MLMGMEFNDSLVAFSKLDESSQNKVIEYVKEDWQYVPKDIQKFNYDGTFFGQALLGRLIKERKFK